MCNKCCSLFYCSIYIFYLITHETTPLVVKQVMHAIGPQIAGFILYVFDENLISLLTDILHSKLDTLSDHVK